LSVAFGLLFVGLSDPGGEYLDRLRRMAVVGLVGTLLTALGFGIGGDPWGYVVLATFVVTVLGGLVINFGRKPWSPESFSTSGSSSPYPLCQACPPG
jgi:O-antigen/teichoic acid export membrane protein